MKLRSSHFLFFLLTGVLLSCSSTQFGKRNAYEAYEKSLTDAGLQHTALGRAWVEAGKKSLAQPMGIQIPFREKGFFAADRPGAVAYRFAAKRGERILFQVETQPATGFRLFIELSQGSGNDRKIVLAPDSTERKWQIDADENAAYILRIQPELLQNISYTISISSTASLAFPVNKTDNPRIASYWGADRDAGARSHEGVDIFAKKGVPVLAAAAGTVTRVNENNLGGKVVFMRPEGKNFSLYYAHLDSQLVTEGQRVRVGEPLGLMGNTGNARTTPAHLHFGIYTTGGAIDPFPFINPTTNTPPRLKADTALLNKPVRTKASTELLTDFSTTSAITRIPASSAAQVMGINAEYARLRFADGTEGYARANAITEDPYRRGVKLLKEYALYAESDSSAAIKSVLSAGTTVDLFGIYRGYHYVVKPGMTGWIKL